MGAKLEGFQVGAGNVIYFIYGLAGIFALVIIYLIFLLIKNTIVKQNKIRKEWKKFSKVCEQKRLNATEIDFLKELVKKYKIPRPVFIVRHLSVFNRYIFREVGLYRGAETRSRENFTSFVSNLRKKLGFADFRFLEELSSTREIPVGVITKTTVTIANVQKNFESKVDKVDEEGVVLTVPDHIMNEEPIREQHPVEINFTLEDDAEYIFNSAVYKVIPGPPGYICINHSRNFSRLQKKKYDRIDAEVPFKYFFLDPDQTHDFIERNKFALTKDINYETNVLKNISAGGMYFDNDKDLEISTLIAITLKFSENEDELKNIVGRVERIVDNDDDSYRIYIKFVKILEANRNKVIHFVFEKKNALKKEKLMKLKKKTKAVAE